ncbi:MAG: hypothetical protein EH225_03090, partial [Calditrichaeota bacterium]
MTKNHILHIFFIFIIGLLLVSGCSEDQNPVSADNQGGHFEAIGLYLIQSGDTIVSYIGGTVEGQIDVKEGEETPLLFVKFLTDDGDVGTPDGPEHSLDLSIADTTKAQVETHQGEDWEFHVMGKQAGATS